MRPPRRARWLAPALVAVLVSCSLVDVQPDGISLGSGNEVAEGAISPEAIKGELTVNAEEGMVKVRK